MSHTCTLHGNVPITHYCDTCKDVVCENCIEFGPHADVRHIVISIEEAVQVKRQFYLAYRDNEIFPLREKVSLKILELQKQQEQYIKDKRVIEKDVNLEFEGINSRITFKINQQIIKRQTQIKANQEVINKIEDLAYSFEGLVPFPQRFLMCYKQFDVKLKQLQSLNLLFNSGKDEADRIKQQFYETTFSKNLSSNLAKPTKSQLILPRQFPLTLAKASQLPDYLTKNTFMNGLIVKTVNFYKEQIEKAKKDVVTNQKRVLSLYNSQNAQLLQLQTSFVCAYCLISFTIYEVNQACSHNKSYKSQPNYKGIDIPVETKGTKMHYWVPAKKSERIIPDLKAHSIVRSLQKKQYLSSLKDIRQVKSKLRIYDIEKGSNGAYLQEFINDDPKRQGKVTSLAFLFIMTNKFQIDETQVQVLSQLCYIKQQNLVNYTKIDSILADPQKLYHQFVTEEQQLEKAKPIAPPSMRFRY